MNDEEFENKLKDFLIANLTLEYKEETGSYGMKGYKIIELKLGKETISEIYID